MYADAPPIAADYTREEMDRVTENIIRGAQRVHSFFGRGFLEKVYENALCLELLGRDLVVEQQRPVHVRYREEIVGDYVTDLLINQAVIVEVKAVDDLHAAHAAQCTNYLRATGLRVCLLLNFGRASLQVRRFVRKF